MDAAIDAEAKTAGLGVVIRDDEWRIVASATNPSRLRCIVSFAKSRGYIMEASSGQRGKFGISYYWDKFWGGS